MLSNFFKSTARNDLGAHSQSHWTVFVMSLRLVTLQKRCTGFAGPEEGGCDGCTRTPSQLPEVDFFVDQRLKTKWIDDIFLFLLGEYHNCFDWLNVDCCCCHFDRLNNYYQAVSRIRNSYFPSGCLTAILQGMDLGSSWTWRRWRYALFLFCVVLCLGGYWYWYFFLWPKSIICSTREALLNTFTLNKLVKPVGHNTNF